MKERIRRDAGTSERQQIGIAIGRIAQELMANFFAVVEDWLGLKQSGEQGRTTDE